MIISEERARLLDVPWQWIRFSLCNIDLVSAINGSPAQFTQTDDCHFGGKAFGFLIQAEVVEDEKPDPEDKVHIIADVRLPLRMGRSHTVVHFEYAAVGSDKTMLSLHFSFESDSPLMNLCLRFKKNKIDSYIDNLISEYENAGIAFKKNDPSLKTLLGIEQLQRIDIFRSELVLRIAQDVNNETINQTVGLIGEDCQWQPELAELTTLYERIQGKASELEQELVRIRSSQDSVATLWVARRMLEVVIIEICKKKLNRQRGSEPLANLLSKIAQTGEVPEYVMTSMQNLNRLSTYGAHPKDFSPRQVREALLALCSIMEWHISVTLQG